MPTNDQPLYIDSIKFENDSGNYYTGVTTTASALTGSSNESSTSGNNDNTLSYVDNTRKNYGIKFCAQLTNRSDSEISGTEMAKFRFVICTRFLKTYYDDDEEESVTTQPEAGDVYITLPNTALAGKASVYVGFSLDSKTVVGTWSGKAGTPNSSVSSAVYIPDQYKTGTTNIVIGTDYSLQYNSTSKITIGKNSSSTLTGTSPDRFFSNTYIPISIVDTGVDGSYTTRSGTTAPDSGYYSLHVNQKDTIYGTGGSAGSAPSYSGTWASVNYSVKTTSNTHLEASVVGDPHITTLSGEHYKFEHLGAFRLLEDEIDGETLIINGFSEHGKTSRRNKREYIKKLYIKYGEKHMYLDTGFRGEAVKVLEESGFFYTEEKLPFNKEAKRYTCKLGSGYSTKDPNEPVTEYLPGFVRNKINFIIDNKEKETVLSVTVENVNEYNLQPCRLLIKLGKISLSKNVKGCLIDRKYAPVCKLDDIKSMKSLEDPSLEDLKNIPELEVDPQLQNIKWK